MSGRGVRENAGLSAVSGTPPDVILSAVAVVAGSGPFVSILMLSSVFLFQQINFAMFQKNDKPLISQGLIIFLAPHS